MCTFYAEDKEFLDSYKPEITVSEITQPYKCCPEFKRKKSILSIVDSHGVIIRSTCEVLRAAIDPK